MWYTPMDKWAQVGDPEVYPYSEGIPISTQSFAHFVQANDANQLEDVFKRRAGRIACLLIEPIMGNCLGIAADPEYLRAARSLCDKYGVVLIIDEVKTGFRVAKGGVQELYGVNADLCTFAKAVANGYPISVLAGREQIMRKIGKGVAHGGTYTAHSVSLAAAEKTLEILDETDALERIADYGTRLRNGMSSVLEDPRNCAQLCRSPLHERSLLRKRSPAQLSRLEGQRLLLLRRRRESAARREDTVRARLPRAVVRQRGPRRVLPHGNPCRVRGCDRHYVEVSRIDPQEIGLMGLRGVTSSIGAALAAQSPGPIRRVAAVCGEREVPTGANKRHDVIVVGAGHNGLVAACYLARAGLDVLVLERNPYIGGAAVSRQLYKDFTYSNCSYVCSLLRTEIIRELDLPRFGLQIIPYDGGCTMMRDGGHLALYDNHDALRREISRHSKRDGEAYDRYARDMLRHCRFIKPLLLREPPDPTSFKPRDIMELLYLGKHFHKLGETQMYDTLRFWTMSLCGSPR